MLHVFFGKGGLGLLTKPEKNLLILQNCLRRQNNMANNTPIIPAVAGIFVWM